MEMVMKRHLVRAGIAAAAMVGAVGCANKGNNGAVSMAPAATIQPLADVHPTTKPVDDTAKRVEALTYKFENVAHDMDAAMSKRNHKLTPEPPDIDFLDSKDFTLSPAFIPGERHEEAVKVVPIEHPTVVATQSHSNESAAITAGERAGGSGANSARVVADARIERRPITQAAKDTSISAGDLEISVAKNLRENPKEDWAQLDYQMLQWLKDKPTPQLEVMDKLPVEDRDFISAIMDSVTVLRNTLRSDSNMLMSRKVRALLELADRLRAQADLIIPTVSLCTKVDGFGVYEPVEPARFTAMKEHPIIVYCEVANFASHQNDKKMWETKLSQEVVLYTETGLPVWQDKTEVIPDLARNRRHDFFVVKKTKFPPNITIGRYLLKVTIVDQQASRVAEATMPVVFVAQ
jgi:hypothetical protein